MTYRIPSDGKYRQLNKGDIFGNAGQTFNADFKTNPGRVRVSSRLTNIVKDNDASITGMGVPIMFGVLEQSAYKYVAVTGIGTSLSTAGTGRIFVSDDAAFTSDWDNEGSSNTPTDIHLGFSDACIWRERLYVTTFTTAVANAIMKELSNITWDTNFLNTRGTTDFKTQGGIKNLCPAFNGNLYFTDDDEVSYVPASGNAVQTGSGTLDFLGVYRPIWIRSGSDRLWIGLMTKDDSTGSKGYVAMWDTTGTATQKIYDINAPCALSCAIKDDIPYIVDAFGRIKRFNGTGFAEIARLPVANMNIEMPGIYDDISNARWIHHRGMDVVDGKICINVNNLVSTGVYVEDMPSGVWELEDEGGNYSLTHKSSPCADANDNGQQLVSTVGAIWGTKRSAGTFLAGYGYYTDSGSTERKGVFYDDVATDTNKRGYITTPFLTAEQSLDNFQKVLYRHSPIPSGDKIIGKYRTKKSTTLPFIASITWVSATQFTSTDANFANVSAGNECEFVQGKHSGTTAHVSSISESGGTYTVNLDDSVGSASGSGKVKMTNFKKMATLSTADDVEGSMPIMEAATRVQIKTEIRATGEFELEDTTIVTKGHKNVL